MESGAIPDSDITASSSHPYFAPYQGRLNGVAGYGAWAARANEIGQWLQPADDSGSYRDLSPAPGAGVTSATISGLLPDRNYTITLTSFGEDDQPNGGINGTYATGNTDENTHVTNLLDNLIFAQYVRFLPQTWYRGMSMRVEILGCSTNTAVVPACPRLLGMESGAIPDGSITASSYFGPGAEPYRGRFNGAVGAGAWAAEHDIIGQWLQVFRGNVDRNTPVTNLLYNPVDARYVRFVVQSWTRHIAMRVDIVGCNIGKFQSR
uniref:F5/8 type C domain-containing protein n=1 Tax=Branchiostoma floridae TaxID=7739 RepID=C3ZGF3_BRAFL|eukprot:XP_002592386.1 hypothetical protein BRAFLDRAFT_67250 [Branchiostoma floridae]